MKQYTARNKEKIAERYKKYCENNKDKIAEKQKEYYKENKEKIAKQIKIYSLNNKEKIADRNKMFRENNKDEIAAKKGAKITCDRCGSVVCRGDIRKHQRTKKCDELSKNNICPIINDG